MSEDHELERPGLQRFGSVIRARRRQLVLTREQLAQRAGTSVPYIGYLETGRRHPSEKMVSRLAKVLGLDPQQLFFLANPGTQRLIFQNQESTGAASWEAFRNDETLRKIHNISVKQNSQHQRKGDAGSFCGGEIRRGKKSARLSFDP